MWKRTSRCTGSACLGTESEPERAADGPFQTADFRVPTVDYCREIEAYLCRKNDGHLIRVVGPSFEIVSGWAAQGIPLKVAFAGIDRYFERYYRKGPRRRPVKIDFCEADVLDAFDEWRRALGLVAAGTPDVPRDESAGRTSSSLPAHLERVVTRLTAARVTGKMDAAFDGLIDRVARELDGRGRRRAVCAATRDRRCWRGWPRSMTSCCDGSRRRSTTSRARRCSARRSAELATYRDRMAADAFARARDSGVRSPAARASWFAGRDVFVKAAAASARESLA